MPTANDIQTVAAFVGLFMLSVWGCLKALAGLCGFVGAWYAPALAWGAELNKIGNEFHTLGERIGSLLPGTPAKMAAKRAAARTLPPALMLVVGLAGIATLGFSQAGCSVFQSIVKNPLVVAASFEQAAEVADELATDAFDAAVVDLPASAQASAQAAFAAAQTGFHLAMTEVDNFVKAYEDGTEGNWPAVIADVQAAIAAVVAVVDQSGTTKAGASKLMIASPAFATARANLDKSLAIVSRYH